MAVGLQNEAIPGARGDVRSFASGRNRGIRKDRYQRCLRLEPLEDRVLLSVTASINAIIYHPTGPGGTAIPAQSPTPPSSAYTPVQNQVCLWYKLDQLERGGRHRGRPTIAIVDAYNDPNIITDATTFSTQFGLQHFQCPWVDRR